MLSRRWRDMFQGTWDIQRRIDDLRVASLLLASSPGGTPAENGNLAVLQVEVWFVTAFALLDKLRGLTMQLRAQLLKPGSAEWKEIDVLLEFIEGKKGKVAELRHSWTHPADHHKTPIDVAETKEFDSVWVPPILHSQPTSDFSPLIHGYYERAAGDRQRWARLASQSTRSLVSEIDASVFQPLNDKVFGQPA